MDIHEMLLTAGRAVLVYFVYLIVIRSLGKRSIGSFTAFDLLVALMLGEIVDEIIYGDVSLFQGGVVVLVVAALEWLNGYVSYRHRGLETLLEGTPTIIVHNGELQEKGMKIERMSEEDVMSQLRLHGIDDLREVKLALLETSGQMSVLQQKWAEPIQKADLGGEEAERKRADLGGQEEPPPDKDTTSRKALGLAS